MGYKEVLQGRIQNFSKVGVRGKTIVHIGIARAFDHRKRIRYRKLPYILAVTFLH